MPELPNSLMNPNQVRHYGVEVQDNPYHRDPMLVKKDDKDSTFVACLKSKGTEIYFDIWTSTNADLREYLHVYLTSSNPWDPSEIQFPDLTRDEYMNK